MGHMKRPGKSGAVTAYISRTKALKKLNLTLKEFRRLCILKGVYPTEPRRRTKVVKGGALKTYYAMEDILHLAHEPIIWKFWDLKVFMKKLKRASGRDDREAVQTIKDNRPFYKLDHIVRERYPTLNDALMDLDDGLSMLSLYSRFAKSPSLKQELITMSDRIMTEFLHLVIETRALRKVFVSVKGFYYQAELQGNCITWIAPHEFVISKMVEVDTKVLKSFTEFYLHLVGFVNFKMFNLNQLQYPMALSALHLRHFEEITGTDGVEAKEVSLSCLAFPLMKEKDPESSKVESFDEFNDADQEMGEDAGGDVKGPCGLTMAETCRLQRLFSGITVFLNREIPKIPVTVCIRSLGGKVTINENDPNITHHIIDRPLVKGKLDRIYVQPQWVFDCVNIRKLLPVQEYFPGTDLPPHLSPFVKQDDMRVQYVTPDAARLTGEKVKPVIAQDDMEVDGDIEAKVAKKDRPKKEALKEDVVLVGKMKKTDVDKQKKLISHQEEKMAVMMIPGKKKRLYDRIVERKKRQTKYADNLKDKRVKFELDQRKKKKEATK